MSCWLAEAVDAVAAEVVAAAIAVEDQVAVVAAGDLAQGQALAVAHGRERGQEPVAEPDRALAVVHDQVQDRGRVVVQEPELDPAPVLAHEQVQELGQRPAQELEPRLVQEQGQKQELVLAHEQGQELEPRPVQEQARERGQKPELVLAHEPAQELVPVAAKVV